MNGLEVEVEYTFEPAQRGCRGKYGEPLEPSWDAFIEVEAVYAGGHDIKDFLSTETMDHINTEIMKSFEPDEPDYDPADCYEYA
jgi:hypothetical protein